MRGALALLLVALPAAAAGAGSGPWAWVLPPGFPPPVVPADNPMSAAKVALGKRLFFDASLSENGGIACASEREHRSHAVRAATGSRAMRPR